MSPCFGVCEHVALLGGASSNGMPWLRPMAANILGVSNRHIGRSEAGEAINLMVATVTGVALRVREGVTVIGECDERRCFGRGRCDA